MKIPPAKQQEYKINALLPGILGLKLKWTSIGRMITILKTKKSNYAQMNTPK